MRRIVAAALLLALAGCHQAPEDKGLLAAKNCRDHMPGDSTTHELLLCEAGSGDPLSQELLATQYLYGSKRDNLQKNCGHALWWLTQSANGGNGSAMLTLGELYARRKVSILPMLPLPACAKHDRVLAHVYLTAAYNKITGDHGKDARHTFVPGAPTGAVQDALKALEKGMKPAELAKAKTTPMASVVPEIEGN